MVACGGEGACEVSCWEGDRFGASGYVVLRDWVVLEDVCLGLCVMGSMWIECR